MAQSALLCNPITHAGALRGAKRKDRLEYVLQIRDTAVKLIAAHGRWRQFKPLKIRLLCAEVGGLRFFYRTPFSGKLPEPSDDFKYFAALRGRPVGNLPYGLDIGTSKGKVLNLEWDAGNELYLASFRRGAWETEILRLADDLEKAP